MVLSLGAETWSLVGAVAGLISAGATVFAAFTGHRIYQLQKELSAPKDPITLPTTGMVQIRQPAVPEVNSIAIAKYNEFRESISVRPDHTDINWTFQV